MEGNSAIIPANQRKIITSDNVTINLEEEEDLVASSVTIKKLLELRCREIRLSKITHQIMSTIIDFCKKNAATPGLDKAGEDEFLEIHKDEILDLLCAADYLKIERLLDVVCRGVAGLIQGLSPQEVRDKFGIVNDLTPEEQEALRREYSWAFDE